jgi:UPF0271 protein
VGARIDLNADIGEGFGAWSMGSDEALLGYVTSANVACGFHAGDPAVIDRTVAHAARAGVAIGAHPGYFDLRGFGRREMRVAASEVEADVVYQVGRSAFARAHGARSATSSRTGRSTTRRPTTRSWRRRSRGGARLSRARAGGARRLARHAPGGRRRRPALRCEAFVDRAYDSAGRLVPALPAGR